MRLYNAFQIAIRKKYGNLSYPAMVSLGMLSGIVGSFIGTPADVVMVRMIADIKLAPGNDSAQENEALCTYAMCVRG